MANLIRVSLVRTGGLGGMKRSASLDTESLDEARAGQLRRLVEQADIAHVAEPTIRATRGRDRFRFTLTVQHGPFQDTLTFAEESIPEALRPLFDMVWREGQSNLDNTQGV